MKFLLKNTFQKNRNNRYTSPLNHRCPQKVTHFLPVELLLFKSLYFLKFYYFSFIAVFVVALCVWYYRTITMHSA